MKILVSKKFWFYTTSITILTGFILVLFPPNEISNVISNIVEELPDVQIKNEISSSLLPNLNDYNQTTDVPIRKTREETTDLKPSVKKITKTITETKAKTKTKSKPEEKTIIVKTENQDLLAILNSSPQSEYHSIIISEDINKIDQWQDIITDVQGVNIPVIADRILPREYFIFGILQNKIISEQAGTATFRTDRNTFSKSGNNILIPIGSIGLIEYSGSSSERLIMEVIRITTPNNLTIIFENKNNLSDAEGSSGVPGIVNNKYFQKYAVPLLFSLGKNAVSVASYRAVQDLFVDPENPNDANTQNAVDNFANDLDNGNNQIIQELLAETLKIKPTITINAGASITIRPTKDIFFEKPIEGKIYLKIDETY